MGNKVLGIFLGSPRVGGNTEVLANALAEGAKEIGYEVKTIRLSSLNLKGCMDCRCCWNKEKHCIQNDDMEKVYALYEEADVYVFAAPLYFYTFSSQIKPIFDRLIPFYSAKSPVSVKGKKAILISAAGDTDTSAFEGMKATFKRVCNYCQWDILDELCAHGIYSKGDMAKLGTEWLEKAKILGKSL